MRFTVPRFFFIQSAQSGTVRAIKVAPGTYLGIGKMKKINLFFCFVALSVIMISCKSDENELVNEEWWKATSFEVQTPNDTTTFEIEYPESMNLKTYYDKHYDTSFAILSKEPIEMFTTYYVINDGVFYECSQPTKRYKTPGSDEYLDNPNWADKKLEISSKESYRWIKKDGEKGDLIYNAKDGETIIYHFIKDTTIKRGEDGKVTAL